MIIDFHTHILPRMDDGSESSDQSLEMLHEMKRQGVDVVVASSHFYGYREGPESFLERRKACYDRLCQKIDENCPRILLGAEVAFHSGLTKTEGLERFCIEGTNVLMVEMPFSPWSVMEENFIAQLAVQKGFQVVLVHPERYEAFRSMNKEAKAILKLPVMLQHNAEAFTHLSGRRQWLEMLESGKSHLLGSDSHNMKNRAPNLAEGRKVIEKKLGKDILDRIDTQGAKLLGLE